MAENRRTLADADIENRSREAIGNLAASIDLVGSTTARVAQTAASGSVTMSGVASGTHTLVVAISRIGHVTEATALGAGPVIETAGAVHNAVGCSQVEISDAERFCERWCFWALA